MSTPLIEQVVTVRDNACSLEGLLSVHLTAVLRAAENLADSRRVLENFAARVGHAPDAVTDVFADSSDGWLNPLEKNGFEVIQGLMQVALHLCADAAARAEGLSGAVAQVEVSLRRVTAAAHHERKGGAA